MCDLGYAASCTIHGNPNQVKVADDPQWKRLRLTAWENRAIAAEEKLTQIEALCEQSCSEAADLDQDEALMRIWKIAKPENSTPYPTGEAK